MARTRHLPFRGLRSIVSGASGITASTTTPAIVAGAIVAGASVEAASVLALSLGLGAANDSVSDCSG